MIRTLPKPTEAEFRKNINTNNQYLDRHIGWKANEATVGTATRLAANTEVYVIDPITGKKGLSKHLKNNIEKPKAIPKKKINDKGDGIINFL